MSTVTKVRSSRVGLIATGIVLVSLLIASQVRADGRGFNPIAQKVLIGSGMTSVYVTRLIDTQFHTVCYTRGQDSMSCVRYDK